jgi:hypothetical protein
MSSPEFLWITLLIAQLDWGASPTNQGDQQIASKMGKIKISYKSMTYAVTFGFKKQAKWMGKKNAVTLLCA